MNDSVTAYQLIQAPVSITRPERMAVKRTPILSRIIPAMMRKKIKTLRKVSEPAYVPKAVESHPRVDSIKSLIGDKISIKMYAKNMAIANSNKAVQRAAAESRKVLVALLIVVIDINNYSLVLVYLT